MAFTDITIKNLKPKPAPYEIPDSKGNGLRVVVWPSGKKVFIVRYRRPDTKKPAKLTLGRIGQTTLKAARAAAAAAHVELEKGRDPGAAKQDVKAKARAAAADTVEAICEEYIAKVASKR